MTPQEVQAAFTHPEEIRTEFVLQIGKHTTLNGKVRTTPAGVICAGLAIATMTFAYGYLARSLLRR